MTAFLTPSLALIVDGVMNGTSADAPVHHKYRPGYTRYDHKGVEHGFAVRPANVVSVYILVLLLAI